MFVFSTIFNYNTSVKKKSKNILIYSLLGFFIAVTITCLICIYFFKPKEDIPTIVCADSVSIELGDSYSLAVMCSDNEASIQLKSANEEIAVVEGNKIFGVGEGVTSVRVIASSRNYITGKNITVNVVETITSLNISLPESITIYLLDKNKSDAYAEGFYDYINYQCNYEISYSLSNTDIVSIKDNKIKANKEGTTILTFSSINQPEITSTHNITVKSIPVYMNLRSKSEISLKVGESYKIPYSLSPSYYTGSYEITTQFENEEICHFENGKIYAVCEGITTVNIYCNEELSGSIKINVEADAESGNPTDPSTPDNPENPDESDDTQTPQEPIVEQNYSIKLDGRQNCNIEENNIFAQSNSFSFTIKILKNGQQYNNSFEIEVKDLKGSYSLMPGGIYMIKINENSSFKIVIESLKIDEEIFVILSWKNFLIILAKKRALFKEKNSFISLQIKQNYFFILSKKELYFG